MRTQEREARTGQRRVWPALGITLGVVALLYFVGWGISGARFSRALARLRAQGEPLTPSDLVPKLRPGERNAADVYEQAFALAPRQALDQLAATGPLRWNRVQLPLARSIVNDNTQYYQLLDEASRLPTCSLRIDWDPRGRGLFGPIRDFGSALQALSVKAQLQARGGDLDGALTTYATALRIADHLEQLPDPVGRMCASGADRHMLEDVMSILSRGDPSPAACRRLAKQLAASDYHALLVRSVKGQRVAGLAAMRWMERGQWFVQQPPRSARWVVREAYPVVAKPLWNADKERYLELMAAYLEAAKRPWPEAAKEVVRLDAQVQKLLPARLRPMAWAGLNEQAVFGAAGHDAATAGAWQVALALQAYHHNHGAYPATLAGAERDTWKLPPDPLTGKPYHYRRDGAGFVVWSVGFDLKDDGARPFPDDRDDYLSPGYDFVVRRAR